MVFSQECQLAGLFFPGFKASVFMKIKRILCLRRNKMRQLFPDSPSRLAAQHGGAGMIYFKDVRSQ
jgi:hypothetical protein